MVKRQILSDIEAFISGADTSVQLANRLEVALDDLFPDDPFLQETVEMLACYRPGGESDVLGQVTIRDRLVDVDRYLKDVAP